MMSVPNSNPELPDPPDPPGSGSTQRPPRANPAPVYRDNPHTEAAEAASARASTVSRRFGSTPRILTRRDADDGGPPDAEPLSTESVDQDLP
jgi:hypothetical protein